MNSFDRDDCATMIYNIWFVLWLAMANVDNGAEPFEYYLSDLVEIDVNQYLNVNPLHASESIKAKKNERNRKHAARP